MTVKSIYPLISFNSPYQIWQDTPANLILELQFLVLFVLCTYDAFIRQTNRMYRIAYWMALISGIMIELLTILPETIGNFYHSQFIIMLLDRRDPLYMLPGVYVWFLYTFTTTIWHMNWSTKISEYCCTVLVIFCVWQPLDLIGVHFQFWTWHNDEPLYQQRNGGVPIASTFWMMSFIGGMQMSLRYIREWYFLRNKTNWHRSPSIFTCIVLAVIGSIVNIFGFMLIPFGLLFHPISNTQFGLGYPCNYALNTFFYLCAAVVVAQSIYSIKYVAIRPSGRFLNTFVFQILIGYIAVSLLLIRFVDVADGTTKQFTYHQGLRMDGVQEKEVSFFGAFERNKYVVHQAIDTERDHYSLECYDFSQEYETDVVEWYGLCVTGLEPQWLSYCNILLLISAVLMVVVQCVVFSHISQSFSTSKQKIK